ncbi:MerR family transcriptional regulator [Brevibacillus sp. SYSU BS000544]|uniref:MerR family transcriptional regulator n=1 Tax=Brevibacillus sp. SYSU BS000544 TaxID=3416443 RepID=UPI003CE5B153
MEQQFSISDLAQEFDISTRTIRYYEELGLLEPARTTGGSRIYNKKDRARLRLILRGKRFGFSLEETKEMIELFDVDRTGIKQLERTIEYGKERVAEVNQRIEEMIQLRTEMEELLDEFYNRLTKLQTEGD